MELKFKILVLRILMMIVYKLAFPNREGRDNQEVERLSMEVHNFMRTMDDIQKNGAPIGGSATPDRPGASPQRATAKIKTI